MSHQFPDAIPKFPDARLTWNLALVSAVSSIIELVLGFTGSGMLSGISQILGIISLLCTFIFYFRSAIVARILQPQAAFAEPLWLIVAFITPILNLVLPWVLLRRIWRVTASAAGYGGDAGIMALHIWWTAFVFAAALIIQHLIVDVIPVLEHAQATGENLPVPPRPLYTHFAFVGQLLIFVWMANRLTRLQADAANRFGDHRLH